MSNLPNQERSLWRQSYTKAKYPKANGEIEVDVGIVGAGITGLSCAYLLKKSGLKVVVLDKDTVGGGTSGRTTGKITSQHGLFYAELKKEAGIKLARLYGEAYQAAVAMVAGTVKDKRIDCDWAEDDNYVFTTDEKQIKSFQQEAAAAAGLGLPASFETSTSLALDVKAAIKFSGQSKMNTQKYLLGLAAAVDGNGSYIFENSNVLSIRDGREPVLRTGSSRLKVKDIIIATNVPTFPLVARGGYCLLEYPTESYIVAGRLKKNFKGMYISPDESNYSVFPITVNGQDWLLIGGESHISGLSGGKRRRYEKLAAYALNNFPVEAIEYMWCDRDYQAYDNIPLIGRLYPWSKHLYGATAFKKWGLAGGTLAGMILNDLIVGRPNPWAAVFDSTRSRPIRKIPKVAAKHLLPF